MEEVDSSLSSRGLTIPQRPIHAIGELAQKFSIPLPLTMPIPGTYHESYDNWFVSAKVYQWYETRYGQRLKMDLSIGKMAFLIQNDIWVFRMPLIYGRARLTAHPTLKSDKHARGDKPLTINILDYITDLPSGMRMSLENDTLSELLRLFVLGHDAFTALDAYRDTDLIKSALSDVNTSVQALQQKKPDFGVSKWSSLQASEKIIKAAISLVGWKFSKTHNLEKLRDEAAEASLQLDIEQQIKSLSCSAGVRYGEEPCDLIEVIAAHHAVFHVAKDVIMKLKELNA